MGTRAGFLPINGLATAGSSKRPRRWRWAAWSSGSWAPHPTDGTTAKGRKRLVVCVYRLSATSSHWRPSVFEHANSNPMSIGDTGGNAADRTGAKFAPGHTSASRGVARFKSPRRSALIRSGGRCHLPQIRMTMGAVTSSHATDETGGRPILRGQIRGVLPYGAWLTHDTTSLGHGQIPVY